ncbi:MAG: NAD(P)-dependent oxidoreductase [Opitutales bacterium]
MPAFWKNTSTLDRLVPALQETVDPAEAEWAVLGSRPMPDLDAFPRLQGIFKCGIGTDNVPFEAAAERGIRVCLPGPETAAVIHRETAHFAVSLILRMLYSRVGDLDRWEKSPRPALTERTVLVVGTGNIGGRVAAALKPFLRVLTYDSAHDAPAVLREALPQADVVSLHVPLTRDTRGLVDPAWLTSMKDGAALVNTARGPLVDEQALLAELKSGRLSAAFDVFWQEPYNGPLRALHPFPFFMTPHVASTCQAFLDGLARDLNQCLTHA